jgi:hypothetical protein
MEFYGVGIIGVPSKQLIFLKIIFLCGYSKLMDDIFFEADELKIASILAKIYINFIMA